MQHKGQAQQGYFCTALESAVSVVESSADELTEGVFWSRLSDLMTRRGWGSVSHSAPHPGVGLIQSTDWAEAGTHSPFSEGLLSGLLSGVAGADVSVIRVPSGSDGASFAYGAPTTIEALQVHLADRGDLAAALEAL